MSTGRRLNVISIQLGQLLNRINHRLNAVMVSDSRSIEPHKIASSQLVSDLDAWQRQLDLTRRELDRIGSTLDVRERSVRSVERSQRFREQQSIDTLSGQLVKVGKQAATVRARLEALIAMVLIPDSVDTINRSFELVYSASEEFREISEMLTKAERAGSIASREAAEVRMVISEARHVVRPANQQQNGAPDWLLLLTLTARIAQMLLLAAYRRKGS